MTVSWVIIVSCILSAVIVLASMESDGYGTKEWDHQSSELVIVTAHFSEKLDWLLKSKYPVIVCDKPGAKPMPFPADPKCSLPTNRGREASSFLKFIVEYYHRLPRYVAFLHGHETAWHHGLSMSLLDAVDRAKRGQFDYINLNNVQHSKVITNEALRHVKHHAKNVQVGHPGHTFLQKNWSRHFEPILKIPFPKHVRFMCCAQFVVSARAIRRHPLSTYKALYDMVMDPSHGDDWPVGAGLEFVWHILFGEPADMCDGKDEVGECTEAHYLASRFVS